VVSGDRCESAQPSGAGSVTGEDYNVREAAQVLGRSVKRVRQMITEGKLEQVADIEPIRVTAGSVHEMRDSLRSQGIKPGRSTTAAAGGLMTFAQVEALVAQLTAPTNRALELMDSRQAALDLERRQVEEALRETVAQQAATIAQLEQQLTQPREASPQKRRWLR